MFSFFDVYHLVLVKGCEDLTTVFFAETSFVNFAGCSYSCHHVTAELRLGEVSSFMFDDVFGASLKCHRK